MKKKTNQKQVVLFVVTALFLNACEGGGIVPWDNPKNIQVTAVIDKVQTRASNAAWDNGDAIGIYMKPTGQALSTTNVMADNIRYLSDGTSAFAPANADSTIQFPDAGDNVDFIAYYPKKDNITDLMYMVDLSDQSRQTEIDLMYSNNAVDLSFASPNVEMTFSHKLSKIAININSTDAALDLTGLKTWITGVGTKANFVLTDGTLSAPTETGDIQFNVNADGKSGQAIVLPNNDLTGSTLVFSLGGNTYTYPISQSSLITSFNPATRCTYNITLNPKENVAIITSANITDWTEGPEENIDVDKDMIPDADYITNIVLGSKLNPYSVEEAKQNIGATGVWVQGYIVGSINTDSKQIIFGTGATKTSNIVIATSPTENVPTNCLDIGIAVGHALNVKDHPENLGRKVKICGTLINFFSINPGLNTITSYEFID
ncbi:MAG: fimbrillin family protein [Dysgonamonadaceae bacterium]